MNTNGYDQWGISRYFPPLALPPWTHASTRVMPVPVTSRMLPIGSPCSTASGGSRENATPVCIIPKDVIDAFSEPYLFRYKVLNNPQLLKGVDLQGRTLLQLAYEKDNQELAGYLLKQGASPLQGGTGGNGLLHQVAANGDLRWLRWLQQQGVDMNYRLGENDKPPYILLFEALANGSVREIPDFHDNHCWNLAICQVFREAYHNGNFQPLIKAVQLGLDFSNPFVRDMASATRRPMMPVIARSADTVLIQWILSHPNSDRLATYRDELGNTAMHYAVINDKPDMVEALKPYSDLDASNFADESPRQLAQDKSLPVKQLLVPESVACASVAQVSTACAVAAYPPIQCTQEDREAFQGMVEKYNYNLQFMEDTGLARLAVKDNNIRALRFIRNSRMTFQDQPASGSNDTVVFISMNDDPGRLLRSYPQFKSVPGAYLVSMELDKKTNQNTRDVPIVYGYKALTWKSKIVITGHGPEIGNMSGEEFALLMDEWLKKQNCSAKETPEFALCSCKTSATRLTKGEGGETQEVNFTKDFVKVMALLGRFPEVTATPFDIFISRHGDEICGELMDREGRGYNIGDWQGERCWLEPGYAEANGIYQLDPQRYRNDLMHVYSFNKKTDKVEIRLKYFFEDFRGLH